MRILPDRQVDLVKKQKWNGEWIYNIERYKKKNDNGPIILDHATIIWNEKEKVSIKSDNDYYYLNEDYYDPNAIVQLSDDGRYINAKRKARVQLSDGSYITARERIGKEDGRSDTYIIEYQNGDIFIGIPSILKGKEDLLPDINRECIKFMRELKIYKSINFIPWSGSMRYASGITEEFKNGENLTQKEKQRQEEKLRAEKEVIAQSKKEEEAKIERQKQERIRQEQEKQAKHNRLVKKYGASVTKEIEAGTVRIGTSEAVLKERYWSLISETGSTRIYADYGRYVGSQYYPDLISTRVVCRNGKVVRIDRY